MWASPSAKGLDEGEYTSGGVKIKKYTLVVLKRANHSDENNSTNEEYTMRLGGGGSAGAERQCMKIVASAHSDIGRIKVVSFCITVMVM